MILRVMPDKNKRVVSNRDCLGRRKGWWLDKGGLVRTCDLKVSWIFCVLDRSRPCLRKIRRVLHLNWVGGYLLQEIQYLAL